MFVAAVPMPLLADELKLIPGLSLQEEWNDNIFLSFHSRQADFITTLSPFLDISSSTERRYLGLSTGIHVLNYSQNASLDSSVDYFVRSGFNYQFDPRLAISVKADYVQDSRPDRIDQNDLIILSGRQRQNYQLSGNYSVSERSTSRFSYSYSQEFFDNPGLFDTGVHSVSVGQDYDLDRYLRQAKLVGDVSYFNSVTDSSQVDNYTVSLGLKKIIHELWYISSNVGGRYTLSKLDGSTPNAPSQTISSTIRTDDLGWIANLSINFSGEKTSGALAVSHDVITSTGSTGATQRTGFTSSFKEKFTRELSGFFGLGYFWYRADQNLLSAQQTDQQQLNFNCGLRYEFSDYVALQGKYGFKFIHQDNTAAQASQNVFMLQLTIQRDLMDL